MPGPGQEGLLSDLLPPYKSFLWQLSPEPVITGILLERVSGDWTNTHHPTTLSHQRDSQPEPSRGHEASPHPPGLPNMCQLLGDSGLKLPREFPKEPGQAG